MPEPQSNAVKRLIDAAGGKSKLSRELKVTFQAIFGWEKAGWMPLARAKQSVELYPGTVPLRELVRPDIAAAMDISTRQTLLD
jgi:hypothetical protein